MATRQACALTLMVFCVFAVVVFLVWGMYACTFLLLGENTVLSCSEQPIQNGVIYAGVANSSAEIKCNTGYMLKMSPELDLRCRLIREKSVVVKAATMKHKALIKFYREYAYVKSVELIDLEADTANSSSLETLRSEAYKDTRDVCVLRVVTHTERLYGQQQYLQPPQQQQASLLHRAGQPSLAGLAHPAWSPLAATASPALLMLAALGALVASGVSRGREGVGHRRVANEPDTAALLEVEDGAATEEGDEDD